MHACVGGGAAIGGGCMPASKPPCLIERVKCQHRCQESASKSGRNPCLLEIPPFYSYCWATAAIPLCYTRGPLPFDTACRHGDVDHHPSSRSCSSQASQSPVWPCHRGVCKQLKSPQPGQQHTYVWASGARHHKVHAPAGVGIHRQSAPRRPGRPVRGVQHRPNGRRKELRGRGGRRHRVDACMGK